MKKIPKMSLYSVVIPVYKNEESIKELFKAIEEIQDSLNESLEIIFVVDGSPDKSLESLKRRAKNCNFFGKIVELSRNFGSFSAIRKGLELSQGKFIGVMAADLQEPPELIASLLQILASEDYDITLGQRSERDDSWKDKLWSTLFWKVYRKLVFNEIPKGGVDIFACTSQVRDELIQLQESNSSIVAQLMWLGYKKKVVAYKRKARKHGKSAWSIQKKINYMSNSILSFTDLPITAFMGISFIGFSISVLAIIFLIITRLLGIITEPGYAGLGVLILFCTMLGNLTTSMVGLYVWRAYENTKKRPLAIAREVIDF